MKSPAFQYYPRDFLSDPKVAPMSNTEVGIYWRLLSYAWLDEGISTDLNDLALLVHESKPTFAKAWKRVGQCFEIRNGRYVNPRQERDRADQTAYREMKSARGKAGSAKRWSHGGSIVEASPSDNTGYRESIAEASLSISRTDASAIQQAMLGDNSASASATAVTKFASLTPSREAAAKDGGVEFATWFVDGGLAAGAIPPDRRLDVALEVSKQSLDDARALLTSYGREECERRAARFFALKSRREIKRNATISALRECWDWDAIAGVTAPPREEKKPPITAAGRRMIEQFERVAAEKKASA